MTKFGSPEEPIILVAGLEPEALKALTSMLQTHGYDVRAVTNGIRTLAFLRSQRPAVVLLPGRLPDMDGFEICRWLRSRDEGRHIPVLLITSGAETELQEEGWKVGLSDFITTPFQQREVLARIKTYVELSQLRAARDWKAVGFTLLE